jgi:hypothetical protein
MSILLDFADGSMGTVHYLANGSKQFPKERVELFSEGRNLVLDNFHSLKGYDWPGFRGKRLWRQDKGHQAEVNALCGARTAGRRLADSLAGIERSHPGYLHRRRTGSGAGK